MKHPNEMPRGGRHVSAAASTAAVRVLYIAGWGRSGSTILGHLLGQMENHCFAGELWYVGDRGWNRNYRCGCGLHFFECPVWSRVAARFADEAGASAIATLAAIPGAMLRTRVLLRQILTGGTGLRRRVEADTIHALSHLYSLIDEETEADLIIDSSKAPMYARLLEQIPNLRLYIVHLVRDPRATGFAMAKRKYDPAGDRFLPQAGALKNALLWLAWNLATELLWNRRGSAARYLRIRYEDFADDPERCLRAVLELIEREDRSLPFSGAKVGRLGPTHSVSGNPDRLRTGDVLVSADEEWKVGMGWIRKAVTVLATWPWLRRYGYRLWE